MLEKITEKELEQYGVVSAPDHLTGNPRDVKAIFDRLVKEVVTKAVNGIVDAHNALDVDVNKRIDELAQELAEHVEVDPTALKAENISVAAELAARYGLAELVNSVHDVLMKAVPTTRTVNGKALSEDIALTAADVGAVKVYRSLSELGLAEATATIADIVKAMANDSILLAGYETSGASAGIVPASYGLLHIVKRMNSYAMCEYQVLSVNAGLWRGYYNGGNASKQWSGWFKIADEKFTAADFGAVANSVSTDISNKNIITAVGGKSGFYRGSNVANAPSSDWFYFYVVGGSSLTVVLAVMMSGQSVYQATINHASTSVQWTKIATTDYALARDGSNTMTGYVKSALGGSTGGATFAGNNLAAYFEAMNNMVSGKRRQLVLHNPDSAADANALRMWNEVTNVSQTILHTGNLEALGSARVVTGSYVGTGVSGYTNYTTSGGPQEPMYPTTITFPFVPKMVLVWMDGCSPVGWSGRGYILPCANLTGEYKSLSTMAQYNGGIAVKLAGTTLSWLGGGIDTDEETGEKTYPNRDQLNESGKTYHYMAIG